MLVEIIFAGDQPIIYAGSQLTITQFNGFTPVAVEDFGSSKANSICTFKR